MKDLLEFLLKGVLGKEKFVVSEKASDSQIMFNVSLSPEYAGLVIGKGGKTIKAIKNLLRVRATLENKGVSINVLPNETS